MSRIRTIKPDFFRSRSLARCTRDARTTFAGLWCDADSAGRGIADPRILKGAIWPLDDDITPEVIAGHLEELAREHITLYSVGEEPYYAVINFEKHQAAGYRQGDPKYPEPPSNDPVCTPERANGTPDRANVEEPDEPPGSGPEPEVCTSERADCTPEGALKGREGKGREPHPEPTDFLTFWAAYPRKIERKKTEVAWRNLTKSDQASALAAIPDHVAAWSHERRAQQHIPHPTTWLHGRRWEDRLDAETSAPTIVNGANLSEGAVSRW